MSQEYEVRPYKPGDEKEIVELLQQVFDGWPHFDLTYRPIDHWKWKYQSNPIGKGPINLAIGDDKIVGSYHTIPQRLKFRDRNSIWGDGVDAAVHPDFRNGGIYNKTLETTKDLMYKSGMKYWKGITGNSILIRSLSKRYPYFPKSLIILYRIKDIDLHIQKMHVGNLLIKKLGFKTLKMLNEKKNAIVGQELISHSTSIL